jgi:predicted DNA-binding transcriptional regulator AlpA
MSEDKEIIKAIGELAAAIRAEHAIPEKARLWDRATLCQYYGVSETTLDRTIVCRPDFPDAVRIQFGPKRWPAREVITWTEKQRENKRAA